MNRVSAKIIWLCLLALAVIGFVHAMEAPECFEEAAYKGWLFYANAVGCLFAALGILKGQSWGWRLGVFVAGGSIIAYVASRTCGLPQIPAEPDAWLEPMGVISLLAEGLYLILCFGRARNLIGSSSA